MDKIQKPIGAIRKLLNWKYIVIMVLIVLASFFGYRKFFVTEKKTLETHTVKRHTLEDVLSLSGEIDALEKADLHFQTGGKLAWVGVEEGDAVKKYQVIASLDQRQLQKTLQKYLNTYSKERRDFEQTITDNDELGIALSLDIRDRAKRVMENAQFDLDNSVIDVELQSISKEYTNLYSPIKGIVTRVDIKEPGVNILVTDTFQVINPESIIFIVSADQTEVVELAQGKEGQITFDAYPDEKVGAKIKTISYTPKTNETGTVYEVKMVLDSIDGNPYRLGMTGDADFVIRKIPNVISIPIEYIKDEEEKQYVFKSENGKMQKMPIEIGAEYGGMVEIKSGLSEGDLIYEIEE